MASRGSIRYQNHRIPVVEAANRFRFEPRVLDNWWRWRLMYFEAQGVYEIVLVHLCVQLEQVLGKTGMCCGSAEPFLEDELTQALKPAKVFPSTFNPNSLS